MKRLAKSTLGKVVLTVVAGMILGPAVGSLMQSAGGALAAGAVEGSLASIVGNGLTSVGSFIGGTGAAAGSGLSGALEAAASSVTTSVGNAISGVKGFFGGQTGAVGTEAAASPGWVSAEGGAGYAGGAAADAPGLINGLSQAAPEALPYNSGANVEQMTGAPPSIAEPASIAQTSPIAQPQSNITSIADRVQQPGTFTQQPGIGPQSTMRGITTQPQTSLGGVSPSTSSRGWLDQIMNDSRAKSALITGGIQVGGGLINGYGQGRAAQAAYERERERMRRNLDVSGVRV